MKKRTKNKLILATVAALLIAPAAYATLSSAPSGVIADTESEMPVIPTSVAVNASLYTKDTLRHWHKASNPNNWIEWKTPLSGLSLGGTSSQYLAGDNTLATSKTALSQFTNDSAFITSSALTGYLLTTTAASTYEPIITTGLTSQYYRGDKTWQTLNKSTISLGNVDNTDDLGKPVSTATQTALNGKANTSHTHAASDVVSGTFVDARIAQSNVTQHQAALTIGQSQVTSLSTSLAGKLNVPAGSTAQYLRGDGTLATFPTIPSVTRTFNYPSRALNSCFQISSTQDAEFHYKVDVASGTLLAGTATGTVTATSYTNSGCTTGTQVVTDGQASQGAALGILSVSQIASVGLDGTLPAGRWIKVTTAQTVGTPTFSIRAVQAETLL